MNTNDIVILFISGFLTLAFFPRVFLFIKNNISEITEPLVQNIIITPIKWVVDGWKIFIKGWFK